MVGTLSGVAPRDRRAGRRLQSLLDRGKKLTHNARTQTYSNGLILYYIYIYIYIRI